MPPTPTSPQGSRAGLITALVVFVVLFVTAAVFAIYYGTQWQAQIAKGKADIDALSDAVKAPDIQSPDVQAVSQEGKKTGETGILVAIRERDAAKKLITGNSAEPLADIAGDTQRATEDVNKQLSTVNAGAKTTIGPDNLLASLKLLSNQVVSLNNAVTLAQGKVDAANKDTQAAIKAQEAIKAKDAETIKAAQDEAAASKKSLDDRDAAGKSNVADIQKGADDAVKAAQAANCRRSD